MEAPPRAAPLSALTPWGRHGRRDNTAVRIGRDGLPLDSEDDDAQAAAATAAAAAVAQLHEFVQAQGGGVNAVCGAL